MSKDFFGALNKRVRIFHILDSVQPDGSIVSGRRQDIGAVWASIEVLNTSYWYNYGKKNNAVFYKVIIRRMGDLQLGYYIDFGGKALEIQNIAEKQGATPTMEMVAMERLQDAG